jgi:hypothetical protein
MRHLVVDKRIPKEPSDFFVTNILIIGINYAVPIATIGGLFGYVLAPDPYVALIMIVSGIVLFAEGAALTTNWKAGVDGILFRLRYSNSAFFALPGWQFRGLLGPMCVGFGIVFIVIAIDSALA